MLWHSRVQHRRLNGGLHHCLAREWKRDAPAGSPAIEHFAVTAVRRIAAFAGSHKHAVPIPIPATDSRAEAGPNLRRLAAIQRKSLAIHGAAVARPWSRADGEK